MGRLIKDAENEEDCQYETVVRLRDNGIVTMPMKIKHLEKPMIKGCANWNGGWSDKFVVTPRKDMETVFEGTFDLAAKVNNGEEAAVNFVRDVKNPELFMRRS